MGNLFKFLILTAPLAALVFYYVVVKQNQMDIEMEKESLKFEQQWHEFNRDFIFTRDKQKAEQQAQQAEQKIQEIEKKEEEKKKKLEKLEQDFEKALEEQDKKFIHK
jgi:CDP-glycerol glycerophosphotransferase (TagB/SpsB family)